MNMPLPLVFWALVPPPHSISCKKLKQWGCFWSSPCLTKTGSPIETFGVTKLFCMLLTCPFTLRALNQNGAASLNRETEIGIYDICKMIPLQQTKESKDLSAALRCQCLQNSYGRTTGGESVCKRSSTLLPEILSAATNPIPVLLEEWCAKEVSKAIQPLQQSKGAVAEISLGTVLTKCQVQQDDHNSKGFQRIPKDSKGQNIVALVFSRRAKPRRSTHAAQWAHLRQLRLANVAQSIAMSKQWTKQSCPGGVHLPLHSCHPCSRFIIRTWLAITPARTNVYICTQTPWFKCLYANRFTQYDVASLCMQHTISLNVQWRAGHAIQTTKSNTTPR